jgi:hypothetical protein
MDGSKWAAPWLYQFVQMYASCIEQPCMWLFYALSTTLGLVIVFADTKNAYQQSPPPTEPCYLEIDDAYHLAMILIHASMLFQCIGHFKAILRLVCCGRMQYKSGEWLVTLSYITSLVP